MLLSVTKKQIIYLQSIENVEIIQTSNNIKENCTVLKKNPIKNFK